jgi:hypothetical protein
MKSFRVCLIFAIVLTFVLLPNGKEISAADAKPNPNRLLSGTYSGIFSGYLVTASVNQPFAGTDLLISDGKGKLTGHETVNFNGHACDYQLKGKYTIAADGTGTDDIAFIKGGPGCPGGSYTQSLAVVDGGDSILLSNTNFPDVATERWYRVRRQDSQGGPIGACCLPTFCNQTTAASCSELNGIYQGDGTQCSAGICVDSR